MGDPIKFHPFSFMVYGRLQDVGGVDGYFKMVKKEKKRPILQPISRHTQT